MKDVKLRAGRRGGGEGERWVFVGMCGGGGGNHLNGPGHSACRASVVVN